MATLKIATWNVNRPAGSSARNSTIVEELKKVNADIVILTETNEAIHPGEGYHCYSTKPSAANALWTDTPYKIGENQVTIWSRWPATDTHKTYDPFSSLCIGVETPLGKLNVYGTVIGYRGNRHPAFKTDLDQQIEDWLELSRLGDLCIAGDLNITFADTFYYTKHGRERLVQCFAELEILNHTKAMLQNIDYIAISKPFSMGDSPSTGTWNNPRNPRVSDHMGVWASVERRS